MKQFELGFTMSFQLHAIHPFASSYNSRQPMFCKDFEDSHHIHEWKEYLAKNNKEWTKVSKSVHHVHFIVSTKGRDFESHLRRTNYKIVEIQCGADGNNGHHPPTWPGSSLNTTLIYYHASPRQLTILV